MACVTTRLEGIGPKKGGSLTVLGTTLTWKIAVAVWPLVLAALTVTSTPPVKPACAARRRTAS